LRRSDRWAGDAKADAPVDVIPPRVTTSIIETTRHVLDDTRVGSPIGQRDDAGDAANGRRLSIHPCHGSESKERAHRASHGLPPPSMSVLRALGQTGSAMRQPTGAGFERPKATAADIPTPEHGRHVQ